MGGVAFDNALGIDAGSGAIMEATEYDPVGFGIYPRNGEALVAARIVERVKAYHTHIPGMSSNRFLGSVAPLFERGEALLMFRHGAIQGGEEGFHIRSISTTHGGTVATIQEAKANLKDKDPQEQDRGDDGKRKGNFGSVKIIKIVKGLQRH